MKTQSLLKKSSRKTHFQHFFSMYLNRSLNSNSIKTETYCLLDSSLIDWDFVLDRSLDNSISIDQVSRISKNQQREKAHNLFVWSLNWNLFELVFKGHYKPSIRRLFRERNTPFMRLGFCNQVFSISLNQIVLAAFFVRLWLL